MDATMKQIMELELNEAASDRSMAQFLARTGRIKAPVLQRRRQALGEAKAGAALVDRMAQAMLDSPKIVALVRRVMDAEQLEVWQGLILEPLQALIAKSLDVAGVDVAGGVLAQAGREMKGVARGDME